MLLEVLRVWAVSLVLCYRDFGLAKNPEISIPRLIEIYRIYSFQMILFQMEKYKDVMNADNFFPTDS